MQPSPDPVRLDRWLWAARLFGTRALAAEAAAGGKVHLNGRAAKASREVAPGDELQITLGQSRMTVRVLATGMRRGSAADAALLFEETEASRAARSERAELLRAAQAGEQRAGGGRPTKRDRRQIDATRGRRG